jgi:hypothetical protein
MCEHTNVHQSIFLNPHLHTAVFVDRKNYRLQDIQLSKNIRRLIAHETHLPAATRVALGKTLVENTGLEPVTSWLQTRRSPS